MRDAPTEEEEEKRSWWPLRIAFGIAFVAALLALGMNLVLVGLASMGGGGYRFEMIPLLLAAAVLASVVCMIVGTPWDHIWSAMVLWVPWWAALIVAFHIETLAGLRTLYSAVPILIVATWAAAFPGVSWLRRTVERD
jgi:hypothetical protein